MKLGTHSKQERRLRAPCARAPLSAAAWSRSGSYAPAQSVLLPGVRTLRCHICGIFYSALVATSGLTVMRLLWPWLDLTQRAPFRASQPSSSPGQAVLQCQSCTRPACGEASIGVRPDGRLGSTSATSAMCSLSLCPGGTRSPSYMCAIVAACMLGSQVTHSLR